VEGQEEEEEEEEMRRRGSIAAALVALFVMGLPAGAGGATQLGETFTPPSGFCDPGFTNLTTASPGPQYAVPFDGVLTSWSYQADASPQVVNFKVARNAGGANFTIVAESGNQTPAPGALLTLPLRVSVRAGDAIGIYTSNEECGRSAAGYSTFYKPSDTPVGTTAAFTGPASYQLDVAAVLEPDADNDGYGDETQDGCPSDPTDHGDCIPADTTITSGPPDKTKKKSATFTFTSDDPGATFECSLDGGAFASCTSPTSLKVKKGKHIFQVRSVDPAGNIDASAATDQWKVKKKRKKR
jgi:hypothetical protein